MSNDYYVYLFLREDGTPYYVGKGKNRRAFQNSGRRMKPPSDKSKIIFHAENLTEDQAFTLEKELIAKYGRKDNNTGILRNLTDGGDGSSGHIRSDETKIKQSATMKEIMNRPEMKAKRSASMKAYMNKPEVKAKISATMKKIMSKPEVKAKLSKALKETLSKPETKAKQSATMKKIMSKPEVKAKLSKALKETNSRPEVKAKRSAASKEVLSRPEVKAKRKEHFRKKRLEREQSTSTGNLAPFFMST